MPDPKPVVVHRKPHQGTVSIPYPELPMPKKFRIRKETKPPAPPPAPEPVKPPEKPIEKPIPVAGPKLKKADTGPVVTEEVQYELPKSHVEEEVDKVKDMGNFVIEPTDWSQ